MDAGPRLGTIASFTAEATRFAEELSTTVQAVAGPDCPRFSAIVSTDRTVEATIRQQDRRGISLTHNNGVPLLRLEVNLYLDPDHRGDFLKVVRSQFRVFPEGGRLPVFRYEYEAELEGRWQPAAHVQFHGDHPDLAQLMADAGKSVSRSTAKGQAMPNITDIHFPVGGSRFRPCLEDVLEMLIHEFSLDTKPDRPTVLAALADGRVRWRNRQLRTAIRDDARTAADQLRVLGYRVDWVRDGAEPEPRMDDLRRL